MEYCSTSLRHATLLPWFCTRARQRFHVSSPTDPHRSRTARRWSSTASARLTFGSWQHRAADLAERLRQRGVAPGDRVGLRFGAADWLDYAVAYVAVQRLGAVAVPVPG